MLNPRQDKMDNFVKKVLSKLKKGQRNKAKVEQFVVCILSVIQGLKPSYLVDHICCSATELQDIINSVFLHENKDKKSLFCVLQFENDLMFCNITMCMANLKRVYSYELNEIQAKKCCVVNVTCGCNNPSIVSSHSPEYKHVLNIFKQIYNLLLSCDLSNDTLPLIFAHFSSDCNLTTVFGILLNYPLIYWYDHVQSFDNCLAFCPLTVYKLLVSPNLVDKCTSSGDNELKFELSSFSFPQILESDLENLVLDWQRELTAKLSSFSKDKDFNFKKTLVILPAVAL